MREIKFRAWHKKQKVMFDVGGFANMDYDIENEYRYVTIARKHAGALIESTPLVKDILIMQYTGLQDKNGVEIYEGDIFRFYSPVWSRYVTAEIKWMFDPTMLDCEGEVIGNIYENTELQEATK